MLRRTLLFLVAATAAMPAAAAPTLDTAGFEKLMKTLAEGWNEGNATKAADCFTEDAVYTEPPDNRFIAGEPRSSNFSAGTKGANRP